MSILYIYIYTIYITAGHMSHKKSSIYIMTRNNTQDTGSHQRAINIVCNV